MEFVEAVFTFDGKHVSDLRHASQSFETNNGALLLDLCESPEPKTRLGATWIAKDLLESGRAEGLDCVRLLSRLKVESEPGVLLHLLQSVQYVPLQATEFEAEVERLTDHPKTLVSVWALDAFVHIARVSGTPSANVVQKVEAALCADKASIRARARHLLRLLNSS